MMVLDMAARLKLSLPARFADLCHDLGKARTPSHVLPRHIGHEQASVDLIGPLCQRLRAPADCRDLALLVARFHGDIHKVEALKPSTVVKLLERCDALRRPERFLDILAACEADYRGRLGFEERAYHPAGIWRQALAAVQAVDAGAIAKGAAEPGQIPARVHEARVAAVTKALEITEE
jgi:tRNA nucleotidyltransferase (CCA-adding enzyme)